MMALSILMYFIALTGGSKEKENGSCSSSGLGGNGGGWAGRGGGGLSGGPPPVFPSLGGSETEWYDGGGAFSVGRLLRSGLAFSAAILRINYDSCMIDCTIAQIYHSIRE